MASDEQSTILEFPITQGQNEGTERAVLPVGQFSYVQNARFRKNNRLGKRNGYTSKTSLDAAGVALGSGNGRLSCLGPNFCAVDDKFYMRDTHADAWALPPLSFDNGALAGTRLYGRFPQFMPAPAIQTLNAQSDTDLGAYTGTAQASLGGMTVALGYLWTCTSYYSATAATWLVRVTAFDQSTGLSVWRKDVDPGVAVPATVQQQPILLATGNGNTLVLIYDSFTAGVKSGVNTRVLTSLAGGFSAEVGFACIQSAANYDPTVANGILFMYVLTGSPTQYTITRMNPATMVATVSTNFINAGNKTLLSCFCNSAGLVWVGYTDAGVFVRTYDATLASVAGSANIVGLYAANGASGPVMFATRTATTVACVLQTTAINGTNVLDADNTAVFSNRMTQYNATPLSQPFTIGAQIFIWLRHIAGTQLGTATLVRVPLWSEYTNNNVAPFVRAFPVEATFSDVSIDSPPGTPGPSGPLPVTPLSTALGFVALLAVTRTSIVAGGVAKLLRDFLVVPVRHRSEGLRFSPSCVVPCAQKQFVAAAQPMWVDSIGEYEAGFIQAPLSTQAAIVTAGGALTANSTYAYSAIFECIDANGLIERSGPAVPITAATTANTTVTVHFSNLELGMRVVRCKVYRTAANGSVFYLVNSVDASPACSVTQDFTFVDIYADSDITQNEALYVNVGQELAATSFPACSFANTGGNRLWVGGGFTGNTITASKQFLPHLAPEFADDDAFRVTLPANCMGMAWCDSQVAFTQEGIYIIQGDGPDGSGNGFFTKTRLPFNIGCIDWRSVAVSDLGVWFQTVRGMYLLPRGFGTPVPMDQIIDTLTTYPIITSARGDYNSRGPADTSEQIVQWTAVSDEAAATGVTITFDSAYKAFYVDTCNADFPATFASGWDGDGVQSPALMTVGAGGASRWHPFRVRDSGFDDQGLPIDFTVVTGDVRPWGTFGHGVVERLGFLGEMRSACTLNVTKTTDKGTRVASPRVYTAIAPDPLVGADFYLAIDLGSDEQKDITSLRTQIAESSTLEGVALIAMVVELQTQKQQYKLLRIADRIL